MPSRCGNNRSKTAFDRHHLSADYQIHNTTALALQ